MIVRAALGIAVLAFSTAAVAAPLTVAMGESWVFTVADGQPSGARKVRSDAKPAKGQLMVTVRSMLGTSMLVTNNSRVSYTFSAELIRGGKASAARSCVLPANGKPMLEHWEQGADAVRIGNFRASGTEGRC